MPFTHVALIGQMASGKTAVGQVLARELRVPFVDVDDAITERTGHNVRELWETGGEAAYRPLERAIVLESLAAGPSRVLAAPGGVVIDADAAEALLQAHVAVVYLRAQPARLAARIRADSQPRPLVGPDLDDTMVLLHQERDERYAALAHRVEEVDDLDPEAVARRILEAFGQDLVLVSDAASGPDDEDEDEDEGDDEQSDEGGDSDVRPDPARNHAVGAPR